MIGLEFPLRFDVQALRGDLAIALADSWQPHFNEQEYGGEWRGIALRSASGETRDIVAGNPAAGGFADTELLARCPYFRDVLRAFQCELKSVRLLSLAPGSFIREHSDHALGYDDGEIRIHIPVQTNPDVEFYVAGERLVLQEGHSYLVNVLLPHRVNNRGAEERIHLVIDAVVNDWVHGLVREGAEIARSPKPARNVDEFRTLALQDAALLQDLKQIEGRAEFSERAVQTGLARGFEFHAGDVDAAGRGDPAMMADAPAAGQGWTPKSVRVVRGEALAEWVDAGTARFTESFYEDSMRVALWKPATKFFRVSAPLPLEDAAPAGLIFHVSRCGSTLAARLLGVAGESVISEAPPLDEILRSGELDAAGKIRGLRRLVSAFLRRDNSSRVFVKLDAWHNREHALLRAAFPEAPWIFVYREPLEVLVSQLARPGLISLPGAMEPGVFGMTAADVTGLSRDQWCARALESIYQSGLSVAGDAQCVCVDYRELPEAMFGRVARHFGIQADMAALEQMREAAGYDAKNPAMSFARDTEKKRAEASALVRKLCAGRLTDLYGAISDARKPLVQ